MAARRKTPALREVAGVAERLFGKVHIPTALSDDDNDDDDDDDEASMARIEENYSDGGDEDANELREIFVRPEGSLGVSLREDRSGGGVRALVERVEPGGLGAAAGLEAGDELVTVATRTPAEAQGVRGLLLVMAREQDAGRCFEAVFFRASGFPGAHPHASGVAGAEALRLALAAGDGTGVGGGGRLTAASVQRERAAEGHALLHAATVPFDTPDHTAVPQLQLQQQQQQQQRSQVSDAVRRGSLAEEGWFALELFDALEFAASQGCSGLYLDVSGAKRRRGAPLIAWPHGDGEEEAGGCSFPDNQLWRHDAESGCLHSKLDGLVADVAGNSSKPGAKLVTWTPTGAPNQVFRVDKVAILARKDGAPADLVVSVASSLQNGKRGRAVAAAAASPRV